MELNDDLDDEDCGMEKDDVGRRDVDSVTDEDTIVVQLEIDSAGSEGTMAIKARRMDGREFAELTLDAKKTQMRTFYR